MNSSFIDALVDAGTPKRAIEDLVAQAAWGRVSALRESPDRLRSPNLDDFFNTSNYEAVRRAKLGPVVREIFVWGMQLRDVAKHVPERLPESFDAVVTLVRKSLSRRAPTRRRLRSAA